MSFPQVSVVVNSPLVRLFSTFSLIASPSRFAHVVLQHPREPRSQQLHLLSLTSHHIQGVNDKATSDQIRQAYKKECKSPYLPRHFKKKKASLTSFVPSLSYSFEDPPRPTAQRSHSSGEETCDREVSSGSGCLLRLVRPGTSEGL